MTIIPVFLLWAFGKSGLNVHKWSMSGRQVFPPTIVSPVLKTTGGYPLLPAGKPTFRNRLNPPPSKPPMLIPIDQIARPAKAIGVQPPGS
jgi:hypothetical protein